MQPAFKYIKTNITDSGSGYDCSNEDIDKLQELVKKASPKGFDRAGGVSSSGEVPLLVLLPNAKKVTVADISKRSLAWTYLKALMLQALTSQEIKNRLGECCHNHHPDYTQAARELIQQFGQFLPTELKNQLDLFTYVSDSDWKRVWGKVTIDDLDLARRRLPNLTLVQDDVRKLKDVVKGNLQLIYMSNAMAYRLPYPTPDTLMPFMTRKSFLLWTGNIPFGTPARGYSPAQFKRDWETFGDLTGKTSWHHQIAKRLPKNKSGETK